MTAGLRPRLRTVGVAAGGWLRRSSYLQRWLVLGAAIGLIAGLGAVVFYAALRTGTHLLLGDLGGYRPPTPVGEGGGAGSGYFARWWAIPLVVAGGGLVSGALVAWLAPEAEGHGTDAAIDAVHTNPRMIRARAVIVKLIASAITIGSGGSGGREGPTAQISAGFGSLLARTLDLSAEDGRIGVSVGIGSGIGAIFGAPLGGAVLAADIVFMDDFEVEALVPGLIASIIAYTVFGLIEGFRPLFGYAAPGYQFHQPMQLLWFAIIGVLAGLVGLLYSTAFYRIVALSERLRLPRVVKPALGGLCVGLLALAVPQVLGTGYGWVQHALDRPQLLQLSLWLVLALPVGKLLATSLSIGSGGSGGIFGPGMVIGAFVGASVWRLLEPLAPAVPHSPASFTIVGMMACFGAIARAPLAMMLMVAEMTGSLTILAPAMVAVGIAYLIVRHAGQTIYRSQLRNREQARSMRLRLSLPLLARINVSDAMSAPRLVLTETTTAADAAAQMSAAGVPGAPVIDVVGRYLGTVRTADLDGDAPVGRLADAAAPTVTERASLDEVLDALPIGQPWLPVLDQQRQVIGIVAVSDLVRAYRAAVTAQSRQLAGIASNATTFDTVVAADSPMAGRPLREAHLPEGTIVLAVQRGADLLAPAGDVLLGAGDLLTILARPEHITELTAVLGSRAADS